jgi:cysteine-rich repeat protein
MTMLRPAPLLLLALAACTPKLGNLADFGETDEDSTGAASSSSGATGSFFTCGDGVVDPGEACDDGNNVDNDGCSQACTLEDDPSTTSASTSTSTTNGPQCGDGVVDAGEECDDGNLVDDDGCSLACTLEDEDTTSTTSTSTSTSTSGGPLCGDGIVEPGEECDDGNTVDDDQCTNTCTLGGGTTTLLTTDSSGTDSTGSTSTTTTTSEPGACGNGVVDFLEECDDGNNNANDGCDPACKLE